MIPAMNRKKLFVLSACMVLLQMMYGQNHMTITYSSPGRAAGGENLTILNATPEIAEITDSRSGQTGNQLPSPDLSSYLDHKTGRYIRIARLPSGGIVNTSVAYSDLPVVEDSDETVEILGYKCIKASATVFSNRVELYYTREQGIRATPLPAYGLPDGLVLKVVRNGNTMLEATAIEIARPCDLVLFLPADAGVEVDQFTFDAKLKESFVTTVDVFNNERISWGNSIENQTEGNRDVTYRYSGGTVILKKILIPDFYEDCTLFAEVTQYSDGDAYDRTGTIFLIPEGGEITFLDGLENGTGRLPVYVDAGGLEYQGVVLDRSYQPPVELVRFFTPFGVNNYNTKRIVPGITWRDSAYYKMDITELLPLLKGEVWIGAFIGNYDRGGHKLSLRLKFFPGSREMNSFTFGQYYVQPLFNTLNILEMSGQRYGTMFKNDSLEVEVDIPEGVTNLRLRYISTGHGGWGGGDEFNPKLNEIFVDDSKIYGYFPWRSDCGAFREYNPASGNFWNGMSSSDYSRSGWCPGSATNPLFIPLGHLTPGRHIIKVAIPLGEPAANSFSHWSVSGVLLGEFEQ